MLAGSEALARKLAELERRLLGVLFDGPGSERGFFTIPPLVVVAPHQEGAFCVPMLAPGRSTLCAGGHSFRSRAIITTSWTASPLRANSRSSPSCTAAVEG